MFQVPCCSDISRTGRNYFDRFTSFVCFSEAYVLSFYGNRQLYIMGENRILTAMN